MYSVYMHTNKINNKKYVGMTKQNPESRWRHGSGYKGMIFYNAINKYGWDGFNHEIIYDGLNHEEACDLEKYLIKSYNTTSKKYGYNRDAGGTSGKELSAETKALIGSYHKGKKLSLKHRKAISYYNSNENRSNWSKAKINYRKYCKEQGWSPTSGKHYTEEERDNIRQTKPKTPFIAIAKDGTKTEWNYLRDCERELGLQHTGISRCLKGLQKQHKGYTFVLKKEGVV